MNRKFISVAFVSASIFCCVTTTTYGVESTKSKSNIGDILVLQGYTPIPMYKTEFGCFVVKIKVCGTEFNLLVDTGAACDLLIDQNAFQNILNKPELHVSASVKGLGKELIKCHMGVADGLSFVDAKYTHLGQNLISVTSGFLHSTKLIHPGQNRIEESPIHGLLGLQFLHSESAVIDHDSGMLYLIPLQKKDWSKLLGSWQCISCERDGKPLLESGNKSIAFSGADTVDALLCNSKFSGIVQLYKSTETRMITIWKPAQDTKSRTYHIGTASYTLEGDSLKLICREGKFESETIPPLQEDTKLTFVFKRKSTTKLDIASIQSEILERGYTKILLYRMEHGDYVMRVKICNTDFNLRIDTGAAVQLHLGNDSFNRIVVKPELRDAGFSKGLSSELVKCQSCVATSLAFVHTNYPPIDQSLLLVSSGVSMPSNLIDPITGKSESAIVDGLVGQQVMLAHSAVIDYDTNSMYLSPLIYIDGPKMIGRWQCQRGECDGKPLLNNEKKWFEIRNDGTAEFQLEEAKLSGEVHLVKYLDQRLLTAWKPESDPTKARTQLGGGSYQLDGDKLKMIFLEADTKKFQEHFGVNPQLKLEAKAGAGHVYYEFERKPAKILVP